MTKTHDESCAYCAKDGLCDLECGVFDNVPTAQNDEGECVNIITDDCDQYEEKA